MHIINLCPSVTSVCPFYPTRISLNSQILSLLMSTFSVFSVLSVCPFLSHTELTELTDIISLDVNIFCVFRVFCVPLSGPTDIRVHPWPLCALNNSCHFAAIRLRKLDPRAFSLFFVFFIYIRD